MLELGENTLGQNILNKCYKIKSDPNDPNVEIASLEDDEAKEVVDKKEILR